MSTHDATLRVLRDARSILDSGGFCKRVYAKRGNGLTCDPTDPRAVSHCLVGAILAAAGLSSPNGVSYPKQPPKEVSEAIREMKAATGLPDKGSLPMWNNRFYRTKRGVIRAFDRAIASMEAEASPEILPAVNVAHKVD